MKIRHIKSLTFGVTFILLLGLVRIAAGINSSILIDEFHGESRTTDANLAKIGGSYNFGQYEVLKILKDADYKVAVNPPGSGKRLMYPFLHSYYVLIFNGAYRKWERFAQEEIRDIGKFVNSGNNMLVISGIQRSEEDGALQLYNPLLSQFGVEFRFGDFGAKNLGRRRVVTDIEKHSITAGVKKFGVIHPVEVRLIGRGKELAKLDDVLIMTIVRHGRGYVVIIGAGSGFMGQLLNLNLNPQDKDPELAKANETLLLNIMKFFEKKYAPVESTGKLLATWSEIKNGE